MVAAADAASGDLPGRYVCQTCGVCIGTTEGVTELRDDVIAFGELYGTAGTTTRPDKGAKTVCCPLCEQALGTRSDSSFLLRRDRVIKRVERLEIMVCSLKSQEIQELVPVLSDVFPHSNITPRVLQKSELRGIQLAPRPQPDFVVVVHKNEGRALLTDRNGFYHDVLGSAWQMTRGNVLVVLTRTELKADSELFDLGLLKSLSTQGDQPTIGAISALGRVLTWESSPSQPQLAQLKTLTSKAYFREPPTSTQGLPGTWVKIPKASTNWCMLL
eukprot:TRINITY_DN63876_c0_g1_i1.p1 TRINITY_DN63876_c0_g1~~TRINITY_DN63876_c0_g1_i1.p1  ORF type:complete len:316 (+),score=42.86 TRINITY_DN63876_c0_g1_i1:131-949(+)